MNSIQRFFRKYFLSTMGLMLLFWKNTHNVEKAIRPILTGISAMAKGKTVSLEEKGDLAEISAEVNRTAKMLQNKDVARAQWIGGVSHDIRTLLSLSPILTLLQA